ncbi:N-formylglutamate amidohydrolase [Sulfitobacter pseudonitzschiae]|uniref:N-formylglutamate amidohydrolase n=1 Tax=Pseudosulfitobacter pseudonitzschiae TaxID=1402135 RepID=A0A9Q2NW58_9RHOB|nr:N-formylglutamate amidohydrolase [Pseudosulfitobacter pseudonitzschiae]MBM2293701.1 N-formylglutamate amidohydrolase [Pseudosulfitobacter pseudonitzschiae]MBM2298515.1 N-formylglutamate amidohydrolase [Pseudosulfitobacter pseudonitzschiae]MBM2303429.1 N-formylglutamate amidohydrolase [Pseudosulfitobacter pseudonitzschiae]MBM2313212.1 N-formylglutamate amidohydrolase [Pseudosulfitobacter pseudonitzschiae]MBM2318125.1 N-formylglutamate amidohydrolase [Pseudosulfitobacter pseudonitzschiae]
MTDADATQIPIAQTINSSGTSSVVLVCEHASCFIPEALDGLGLSDAAKVSHAAWDPGALGVARQIAKRLDAVLVASCVSRLVYDCNRPPEAPGAMPAKSEIFDVPGNAALTTDQRADRAATYYVPFRDLLVQTVAARPAPVLVTIHSFTPVYNGTPRAVEIGVLHDADTRLADAMLDIATAHTSADVQRNAPYGPGDGVTHTLQVHGTAHGHPNVMIEVRNDLIQTEEQQAQMGDMLAEWLNDACGKLNAQGVACSA